MLAPGGGGQGSWTSRDHGHPHMLEDFSASHTTSHETLDNLVDALGGEDWSLFVGSGRHSPFPHTYDLLSRGRVDTTGQGRAVARQRDVIVHVTGTVLGAPRPS